jgi:hypothetical protein
MGMVRTDVDEEAVGLLGEVAGQYQVFSFLRIDPAAEAIRQTVE